MVKLSFLRVILLGLVRIEDFDLMFHGLGGLAGKGAWDSETSSSYLD